MALFHKKTKTRLSSAQGNVKFKKFKPASSIGLQRGISIELTDKDDGRIYSLTLYDDEIRQLAEQVATDWPNE